MPWLRPALFASTLITTLDSSAVRRVGGSIGGQIDLRIAMLSELEMTLSLGGAVAVDPDAAPRREAMVSLSILR